MPPAKKTPKGISTPADARALAALQKMAKPQPKATEREQLIGQELGVGSGSATGFVGMLAKRQFPEDIRGPISADNRRESSGGKYPLRMAREVRPSSTPPESPDSDIASIAAAQPAPSKIAPRRTGLRLVARLSFILAILLLLVSLWAGGALIYMNYVTPTEPRDVHYPLLTWQFHSGADGTYTRGSRLMPLFMLLCLPISLLLLLTSHALRKRIKSS